MMITREQILREERDEIREKCEELSTDLEKYRQESEDYHRKYTQVCYLLLTIGDFVCYKLLPNIDSFLLGKINKISQYDL